MDFVIKICWVKLLYLGFIWTSESLFELRSTQLCDNPVEVNEMRSLKKEQFRSKFWTLKVVGKLVTEVIRPIIQSSSRLIISAPSRPWFQNFAHPTILYDTTPATFNTLFKRTSLCHTFFFKKLWCAYRFWCDTKLRFSVSECLWSCRTKTLAPKIFLMPQFSKTHSSCLTFY